uniref:Uncharacterized protein n=1 Tax=Anguilla anguilla TaxID=7936 RepID=A0A0E9UYP0_ANGAN
MHVVLLMKEWCRRRKSRH